MLAAVGVLNGSAVGLFVGGVVVGDAAVLEFVHGGHRASKGWLVVRFVGRSVASPRGGLLPVEPGPKGAHSTFCPSDAFLADEECSE